MSNCPTLTIVRAVVEWLRTVAVDWLCVSDCAILTAALAIVERLRVLRRPGFLHCSPVSLRWTDPLLFLTGMREVAIAAVHPICA